MPINLKESSNGDRSGIYHEGEMAIGLKIAVGLLHFFNNNGIPKRVLLKSCLTANQMRDLSLTIMRR
ncbi:hypothetical protein BK708_37375 [Bacillus thuringiensis serovar yunnanensis]|nr:hypothetical protein BK708_37375 [Bacillus thuringiensis serovar yunnanensis]